MECWSTGAMGFGVTNTPSLQFCILEVVHGFQSVRVRRGHRQDRGGLRSAARMGAVFQRSIDERGGAGAHRTVVEFYPPQPAMLGLRRRQLSDHRSAQVYRDG